MLGAKKQRWLAKEVLIPQGQLGLGISCLGGSVSGVAGHT